MKKQFTLTAVVPLPGHTLHLTYADGQDFYPNCAKNLALQKLSQNNLTLRLRYADIGNRVRLMLA